MRAAVLVVAKAPVSGLVKTRLQPGVGPDGAADLAAAALLDTLDACESAFTPQERVIALTGDLALAARTAEVSSRIAHWMRLPQRGRGLGERLANAHADAARLTGLPVLQLGMDTPQVTRDLLDVGARTLTTRGTDAVLGLAEDGGWWALGLRDAGAADVLSRVPMSQPTTGAHTFAAIRTRGRVVALLPRVRDVDTPADAMSVAAAAPGTRFAATWRDLTGAAGVAPADLFDEALAGSPCVLHGLPGGPVRLPVERWTGTADEADLELVAGCTGPVLDVGCGPGRLTHALASRGLATLGIDIAAAAVNQTLSRGATALQRDVFDPLPGEGRWGSVVLADGNIGIGGDPIRLLRRVDDLLAPRGCVFVEAAAPGEGVVRHALQLEVGSRRSTTFWWASVSADALGQLAEQTSLRLLGYGECRGRWFAKLTKARVP